MVQSLMSADPATYTPLIVLRGDRGIARASASRDRRWRRCCQEAAVIVRPEIVAVTPGIHLECPAIAVAVDGQEVGPWPSIVMIGVVPGPEAPSSRSASGAAERDRLGRVEDRSREVDRIASPGQSACWTAQRSVPVAADAADDRIDRVGDGERGQELAIFERDQLRLPPDIARRRRCPQPWPRSCSRESRPTSPRCRDAASMRITAYPRIDGPGRARRCGNRTVRGTCPRNRVAKIQVSLRNHFLPSGQSGGVPADDKKERG